MTSIYARKTPVPDTTPIELAEGLAAILKEELWGGSHLQRGKITLGSSRLQWFEGLRAGLYRRLDERGRTHLMMIVDLLREGQSVDLWIE